MIMKKTLKYFYRMMLPPIIARLIDSKLRRSWYFRGCYPTWEDAKSESSGYDDKIILNRVLSATLKVKSGEAVYERDSVTFNTAKYEWPLLANLMWVAARNEGKLNVLDFGGALGSTYFQNKKYLDLLPNLSWNIVEQRHYVSIGNEKIASDSLKFYESIDECIAKNNINVAIFSGVLDVIENPYEILYSLFSYNIEYVIIDRSAFLKDCFDESEDRIVVQVIKPQIFDATLPFRIISPLKMKDYFKNIGDMKIIEEFDSVGGEGEDWKFKGFLASRS